jgi:hypothetical protein
MTKAIVTTAACAALLCAATVVALRAHANGAVPTGPCGLDVDCNGHIDVATDVVYIARHLLGLVPVPPSFRALDPSIPPDGVIANNIDHPWALPATGQTTPYGPGSDGDLQAGMVRQYVDNGDGTITDTKTGLMWEKKDQEVGGVHNYGNLYTWGMAASPYTMNGTMVTSFLATLNTEPCFAGHCDWRIPNRFELESLLNLQNAYPAVDLMFKTNCTSGCSVLTCSCTQSFFYWSSTTVVTGLEYAWNLDFGGGSVITGDKDSNGYVRAVRGGL